MSLWSIWRQRPAAPAAPVIQDPEPEPYAPGTPEWFRIAVLEDGLGWLRRTADIPGVQSAVAQRLLLAIAMQESGLRSRFQVVSNGGAGPARGWWQFEQIGLAEVLRHPASQKAALACCRAAVVLPEAAAVWRAVEGHDRLATAFARLALWRDPNVLPVDEEGAWQAYIRIWRPGKPHRDRWTGNWQAAGKAVRGS